MPELTEEQVTAEPVIDVEIERPGAIRAHLADVVERLVTIERRLAGSEHV